MLVSNRDFPIGNACNDSFELWRQELSSAKDTISEYQIKVMSGYGSHVMS